MKNVRIMVHKLRLAGLELNSSKCKLAILGHQVTTKYTRTTVLFQEILPDMKILTYSQISLLGAPISDA